MLRRSLRLSTVLLFLVSAAAYASRGRFLPAVSYPTGTDPYFVAIGDFNGDGKQDLAVVNYYDNSIKILLGKENGTFQSGKTLSGCMDSGAIQTGDLNGDSRADLIVTCAGPVSGVMVLLNSASGFLAPTVYASGGTNPNSLVIADLDGDGILDVVVVHASGILGFLKGNGDGSFQAPSTYDVGGLADSVVAADFNGDHYLDLVVGGCDIGACLFLGNGDGTFQFSLGFSTGGEVHAGGLAYGDFNGDGHLDLAVANTSYSSSDKFASIILGNGDGSFQPPASYTVGKSPQSVTVADFNGDGVPDVAVAIGSGAVTVMYGRGDGSFPLIRQFAAGLTAWFVTAADFNRDRAEDLAVVDLAGDGVWILLNSGGTFVTATSSENPAPAGQPVTFTATIAPSLISTIPTGTVQFADGTTILATVPLDQNGVASYTTSGLTTGTHTIRTKYSGDSNFNPNTGQPIVQVIQ